MRIILNNKILSITTLNVIHFCIISFFLFYVTRDLNYNSSFVDEAIYATVGEEVLRDVYWEKAISWMGGSYLYPLMSAYANRYYGLTGVRLMSSLLILLTGIISGKIAYQFAGYKTEVLTLFLFFSTSITLDIAQLGTYDTPAIAFLAVSMYAAMHSRYHSSTKSWVLVVFSSFFFTLATFAKYITIIFIPSILLMISLYPKHLKLKKSLIWLTISIIPLGFFVYQNSNDLTSLFITNPFTETRSRPYILSKILNDLALHIPLALSGIILALLKQRKEKKNLLLVLFLAGLTPLLFHLATANARSLWKHLVFTLAFWTPIGSFVLLKLNQAVMSKTNNNPVLVNSLQLIRTIVVVTLITSVWVNFSKHWRFQRSWPSATNIIEYLKNNRKTGDVIFAEASTVYKYHLYDGFEDPGAWPSTWYFNYEGTTGVEAMKKAIRNKEFKYIILNDFFTPDINKEILPAIEEHYSLLLTDTFKVSGVFDQTTRLWTPK